MGLDFPFINSKEDQRKEWYYKKIVEQLPQLDNTPELLYGDLELLYLRKVNNGEMTTVGDKDLPTNLRYLTGIPLNGLSPAYGAKADGVTDDTTAVNAAFTDARLKGKRLYFPKGTAEYFINGTIDCSGVDFYGDYDGYQGALGTIFKGNGSNTVFKQQSVTAPNLTMKMKDFRVINCATGIDLSYTVFSHLSDITVYNTSSTAIIFGSNSIIGPLFNSFDRVSAYSSSGNGILMQGDQWCNNNIFTNCDFKGTGAAAVKLNSSGGYGAINNIFKGCELRGNNVGLELAAANWATKLEGCYLENLGPAVWCNASSADFEAIGCVYGSLTNNNSTGKPNVIHHTGVGLFRCKILGGMITTGATSEFDNLRFVHSDTPANLSLDFINEPNTNTQAAGFKFFDETIISTTLRRIRGNMTMEKYSAPTFTIAYPDGSRPFEFKRNGTQGGSDFGAQIRNNGITAIIIDNNGRCSFQQDIGTNKKVTATGPVGNIVAKVAWVDNAGNVIGQMPLYDTIT